MVAGVRADRSALTRLLHGSDLCAVLCHGYVAGLDNTVAWLLAEDGALPLHGSVEADSPFGRRHHFTW